MLQSSEYESCPRRITKGDIFDIPTTLYGANRAWVQWLATFPNNMLLERSRVQSLVVENYHHITKK